MAVWRVCFRSALHRSGVIVTAIELPTQLHASDVYATQPALEALHNRLRIDEAELLRRDSRRVLVGSEFRWCGRQQAYFHAYGAYGSAIDYKAFFPHWLRARALGSQCQPRGFLADAAARREAWAHARSRSSDGELRSHGLWHIIFPLLSTWTT